MTHDRLMTAAVVAVGTELVEGLRVDTNTRHITLALSRSGHEVLECIQVGDDVHTISTTLQRLCDRYELVVSTGGLGPTHDDLTREAVSRALGLPLVMDTALEAGLLDIAQRHQDMRAAAQVLRQAMVFPSARVFEPTSGTAPGQLIPTPAGQLLLLPGPPHEMQAILDEFLSERPVSRARPREIGCTGIPESDAQIRAQTALADHPGVSLTVLSSPGDVRVILLDAGAGEDGMGPAAIDVAAALGDVVYALDGATLPEAVLRVALSRGITIATAESCTGGMVSSALTSIPGSSEVFLGGIITYDDFAKSELLGVPQPLLAMYGAVSEECAKEMASGAQARLGSHCAVSITGIAGPGGATAEKPVGLVWIAIATTEDTVAHRYEFLGDRDAIRSASTAAALDLLRRTVNSL